MKHNHRLVISIIMIIFVVIIAFSIAGFNFFEYKRQVENNEALQLNQIEGKIKNSLETLNKAYALFDNHQMERMREVSDLLVTKYEHEKDFSKWDFEALSEQFEMDIYVIDQQYKII